MKILNDGCHVLTEFRITVAIHVPVSWRSTLCCCAGYSPAHPVLVPIADQQN